MIDVEKLRSALSRDLHLDGDVVTFPTNLTAVDRAGQIAEFRARYQLYNFSRKLESEGVPEWQRTDAFNLFLGLQKRGEEFNRNFTMTPTLERARDIIHRMLPPLAFVENEIWPLCNFGPGTFNGASKVVSYSLHYKIGHDQTVTEEAKGLFIDVLRDHFPSWAERLVRWKRNLSVVDGNRLTHVVKDTRKCRPIAVEPSGNVFLQQGIGRWLMRHLRNEGFADLYHGQARNRELAGDLSNGTIDLSSASDTIFLALVKALVPADWFELLDATRSRRWKYRDRSGTYANLSSQGNAFTFPVETLIFKAVVMAATNLSSRDVTVYGDDIICPVESCPAAVVALEEAGFTVNSEKSYWGQHDDCRKYFRESCGADYFYGTLVTPMYVRKQPKKLSDLAVVYNRLIETWPEARRAISLVLLSIPDRLKDKVLFGPRYFITDSPEKIVERGDIVIPLTGGGNAKAHATRHWGSAIHSVNSVVSVYNRWFWTEGPLEEQKSSNRGWYDKVVPIRKSDLLGEEVSYATFLCGGEDDLPRSSNPRSARVDMTPVDRGTLAGLAELKGGLRAPWRRFELSSQIG